MQSSGLTIIRETDAVKFMEGDERCSEYLREPRMWFGTSTLLPGEQGAIDPGHDQSVEVFYCCLGSVVLNDGERDYELSAGEAAIIPIGLPHALRNIGDVLALVVWAGAPGGK
jgi:mannose-6-phosphate isomerase-like protein (cupin superfamily)